MDLDWVLPKVHEYVLDIRRDFKDFVARQDQGDELRAKSTEVRRLLRVFEDQIRRETEYSANAAKRAKESKGPRWGKKKQ